MPVSRTRAGTRKHAGSQENRLSFSNLLVSMPESSFASQLLAARQRLFTLLDKFQGRQVLVVGDLTLDEFLTGAVERISREAPVLILRHEQTQQIPGGGANAAYNFAQLGAQVKAVGLVGKDLQGQALRSIMEAAGIDTVGVLMAGERPTVTKTRVSGHARQSVTQQIVRIDRKSDELPAVDLQIQLAEYIQSQVTGVEAVVCSDYGDGVLTPRAIAAAIAHQQTIIDTQTALERYAGATWFTPNLPEAEQAVGFAITDEPTLLKAGYKLLERLQAQYVLITRGGEGMSLFARSQGVEHIPAFNRTEVFDVTGAGDTVVAGLTLALCAGATPWEAVVLGNLAASIVVRKFGTATTNIAEMKEALQLLLEEIQVEA